MSRIVVEPVPPARLPQRSGLVGCSIAVDTDQGTLTWTGDTVGRLKKPPTVLPLRGPGAVTKVVVADYVSGSAPNMSGTRFARMLFVDEAGVVLVKSRAYLPDVFAREWPAERLATLRAGGVDVQVEHFSTATTMQAAHPGAAPVASWASPPRVFLPVFVIVVLIIAGILLFASA